MKKIILVLVVVAMLVGVGSTAFAQNLPGVAPQGSNPKNAVNVDLGYLFSGLIGGGFGIGAGYERAFTPFLSGKFTGAFVSWPALSGSYVNILAEARWYFLHLGVAETALNGPYAGLGGGVSLWFAGGTSVMPVIFGEAGYKFTVMNGGTNGFFVEPFIGFRFQPFTYTYGIYSFTGNLGGFMFGANIGWAF